MRSQTLDNVYRKQTERLVGMLEQVSPDDWRLPWHNMGSAVNVATENRYNKINALVLPLAQEALGYKTGIWGTFLQYTKLGIEIDSDETKQFEIVTFSAPCWNYEKTGKKGMVPRSTKLSTLTIFEDYYWARRYTRVYNLDQTTNWRDNKKVISLVDRMNFELEEDKDLPETFKRVDSLIESTGADISHSEEARAYYNWNADAIHMPHKQLFKVDGKTEDEALEAYYSTALHELGHWTGHESRLNRKFGKRFGDQDYIRDELVAEICSALTCVATGVTDQPRLDHAQYLKGWLEAIRDNPNALAEAASKAQAAADFIMKFEVVDMKAAA